MRTLYQSFVGILFGRPYLRSGMTKACFPMADQRKLLCFCFPPSIFQKFQKIVSPSNKKPSDDYKRLYYLGEDSYAPVYSEEIRITGRKKAMKVLSKGNNCNKEDYKEIANEISVLRILDHSNILKIFEF